ncbi:class I adenylate-forming enzyme family protein [Amorphoplanes nipponensis]|uniref:AMP-dependent synthetase and ligase n=1 Tax=Actinoplanes nipponensis TaxID=135950 RepID=A0A919JID3_9ACTN|nr:AMP-binding protein [Actinoplanes nipponensis]GIE47349.1 AMP-dependent synthetase and ligase [Actinoplanes nipponensis]
MTVMEHVRTGLVVDDLLREAVARRPHARAVSDATGGWTYAELDAAARTGAAWLAAHGIGPGDRVVCRAGNVREFVALLFATLRHGAIFVPINPGMRRYHLRSVLADADPRLVVTGDDDAVTVREVTDRPVVGLGTLRAALSGPSLPPAGPAGPAPNGDATALLIYTSGSTAAPKAVVSPHGTVVFAARAIADRLRYRADDVVLCALPLAFDYGLYQVFLSVLAGAHLVLGEPAAHVRLISTIREHGVTVVPVVPSLAEMLVRLAARHSSVPAVRLFTNTGAALTAPMIAALRQRFPGAGIVAMFGITECKRVTIAECDGDRGRPGSVGTALDGTQVLILDDAGHPLPPGECGEIAVRGPHVMAGYWRAPQLSAQRFRRDPDTGTVTLHTGDYGRLDADGHLYFEGRRDDIFKRRGLRVSAVEIEAAACDVPGVRAAAVLPPTGRRDVALFAVTELAPADVLRALAERIEDGKLPPACHVLPQLPLTANGKTDKRRLAELLDQPQE